MRELPEPEVANEIAEAQSFLTMWKSVTVKPMTTREVDFAKLVRKQAYEDGLRDAGKDAERYRWLRDRKSLELRSDCGKWTRIDGSTFIASHFLAEGGTQHSAAPSLDETIDSAMLVAMLTASQKEAP